MRSRSELIFKLLGVPVMGSKFAVVLVLKLMVAFLLSGKFMIKGIELIVSVRKRPITL